MLGALGRWYENAPRCYITVSLAGPPGPGYRPVPGPARASGGIIGHSGGRVSRVQTCQAASAPPTQAAW
jgi:hypothetical protein